MTPFRCFTVRVLAVAFLLISLSTILSAQSNDARITGIVTDPSKAVIRDAKVVLVNVDTSVRYPAVTNGSGIYTVSGQVGNYRIEVEHVGFKTVIAPGIVLHTQDVLEINFEMAIGSTAETVTINAGATNDSPAVSMTVDREFVESMPLNGQSFQDLIQLAPGVVSISGGGGYSIDGQRTDSNIFTVDGVSANLGGWISAGASGSGSAGLSGDTPMGTALGTTQSLASIDSLQEFKIQTSGYTAEYGRSPGGQVQFTTRSGSNETHGTLFDYLRNTAFDANSDSNDYYGDPKSAEHQNDFGGTLGGPLAIPKLYSGKDKTFYFLSYEGLRLLLPSSSSLYVPTQAFRNAASPNVQPFLNVDPLPNPNSPGNNDGCTITDPTTGQLAACDAHWYYAYSTPNNLDNYNIRVDHSISKRLHAFLRYADNPSSASSGTYLVNAFENHSHIWTAGLTANLTPALLNDLRFNYTRNSEEQVFSEHSVDGAVPTPRSLLIPDQYENPFDEEESVIIVRGTSLRSTGYQYGTDTLGRQYELVEDLAWSRGKHAMKVGADWRRVAAKWSSKPYLSFLEITSLAAIEQGYANLDETGIAEPGSPVLYNLSLYAQDHWNVNSRLSIDYGLRWELNPPPGAANGEYPAVLTSSNLATAAVAPLGTPPYKTQYNKFAPRFGFAWNAIPSRKFALTVRGGFGIFYDTGQQTVTNSYEGGYPYAAYNVLSGNVALPLSSAVLTPPALDLTLTPPYGFLQYITSQNLTMPYTEQWTLSLDVALNPKNTLTVSYVGNNGKQLLFDDYFGGPPDGNQNFPSGLEFTNNAAQSGYNALQVQDVGQIASGLDLVGSFTWAHALDNVSTDQDSAVPLYGNSDNDLRRALNLALNYKVPASHDNGWLRAVTSGWLLANRFSAQSGYPVQVFQDQETLPGNETENFYPNLVPHVSIYLHGSTASVGPGLHNWRLNPAAFAQVPTDPSTGNPIQQGTLGRNYLRTPSFWALNTAVQRNFSIYEKLHLNFRVDAFNILNHPNLQEVDTGLTDSTFGELEGGQTATIGTPNQLYAMGAARSLQLSLKLQF